MKSFKGFSEMMTAGDAGIPQDTANMKPKGKRALVTRRYIEINGKRKLQCKESSEKKEACWDSHKQVGMKKKGGKTVPNCVPKNESVEQVDEGMLNDIRDFIVAVGAALPTKKNKKARTDKALEDQIRSAMQADPEFDKLVRNVVFVRKDGVAAFKNGGKAALRKYVTKTVDSATAKKLGTLQTRWMKVKKDGTVGKTYSNTMGQKFKDEKGDPTKHKNVEDMMMTHIATTERIGKIIKQVAVRANQKNESVEITNEASSGDDTLTKDQLPRNVAAVVKKVFKVIKKHKKPGRVSVHKFPKGKYSVFIAVGRSAADDEDYTGDLISIIPWEKRKNSKIEIDVAASQYPAPKNIIREDVEQVENLEEKTFKANVGDKDYQKIRSASMRGNFTHKFSRKTNGDVTFNTKNPATLAKDLEKLIDSGASSWSDILDIHGV